MGFLEGLRLLGEGQLSPRALSKHCTLHTELVNLEPTC